MKHIIILSIVGDTLELQQVLDRVSIGLGGRADEVVFEAIVKDFNSPLYNNIKAVLRKLVSIEEAGSRHLDVYARDVSLSRRPLLEISCLLDKPSFLCMLRFVSSFFILWLYHGSFSLRHWLQQSDWLPTLEANLLQWIRNLSGGGDDTVGGPVVSRQLQKTRKLMRDLLIGVCELLAQSWTFGYRVESGECAYKAQWIGILNTTSLIKLCNMWFLSCVDVLLCETSEIPTFQMCRIYDGKNGAAGTHGSINFNEVQIIPHEDTNCGAGWNLLSLLLATKPSKRISCLDALRHPFLCGPRLRVAPSLDIIRWGLGSTAVRITEEYIYKQPQVRLQLAFLSSLLPFRWINRL
ncbi:hypothetical protein POTOM_061565 [Populus tomentosa]|uniref:Protein kinase domain-containing protein n=1 Tax=Populus tomentosa TaxID=118781 RepID=A0A8X7XSX0_POPTO|nr:hypothetical protein POTOM_061565 [Populus tomentosa]